VKLDPQIFAGATIEDDKVLQATVWLDGFRIKGIFEIEVAVAEGVGVSQIIFDDDFNVTGIELYPWHRVNKIDFVEVEMPERLLKIQEAAA
jgi:hypothetical protein